MPANTTDEDQIVRVPLGCRAYDIRIGGNLLSRAGEFITPVLRRKRVAIITDDVVGPLHLKTLEDSLNATGVEHSSITLPAGEATKSMSQYGELMDTLLEKQVGRDEALIALGGGVIGDLTGFAASTLRRGIDFIQIPTTLLSQVDSSVGGKTGINSPYGKNLIGAFYQPKLVLADVDMLNTLSKRELLAGYAEVVKYGLLGDFAFFEWLEKNGAAVIHGETAARIEAVKRSVQAKADIVQKDEREGGVRALLNLGHTFGHALEAETGYGGSLVHGEGVAIGMLMAMDLSATLGHLKQQDIQRVEQHYDATGLLKNLPSIQNIIWNSENLLKHMYQDKKVDQGKLTFILMKSIGNAFITQEADTSSVLETLEKFVCKIEAEA
ncbi:3-dehydroquinate synthase [Sneathiella sp. P13V-1]|uniref:3-dehydroquinate synthase n=1 Tax=Sneathiella sp. P13V-1 TaxID=2697366 RepID=UPI00187BB75B|nr:3-dehydroquinate synthase [Sneathiella sp. P13V-1]MBE7638482.1 3-dehydroquinate synthase [Sneathiella sp. P13V-1]